MKPTCANSTSAKAIDTDRKPISRNARARICDDESASLLEEATSLKRSGGGPTKINTTGITSTIMTAAANIIALENPNWPIAITSSGTPAMPPKLAPFSARLIAMPRF